MTTKVTDKQRPTQPKPEEAVRSKELRTAYEAHTLAQMLYGHLAAAHQTWGAPTFPYGPTLQAMPRYYVSPWARG